MKEKIKREFGKLVSASIIGIAEKSVGKSCYFSMHEVEIPAILKLTNKEKNK